MTKKTFLSKLRTKLSILEAKEIDDILEEYSSHIDVKKAEGKTEKEAVSDFGDLDALAKEILSAYKVNINSEQEGKIEQLITKFIDTMVDFFTKLFDNVADQKVSKILITLFYIIIVMILLSILIWVMKIPFEIAKEIGLSIINVGGQNILTDGLAFIWTFFVDLSTLVILIIIIAGLFKKGIVYFEENKEELNENKIKKETIPIVKEVTKKISDKKKDESFVNILTLIVKILIIFGIYIPLIMSAIGIASALGVILYLTIQGLISIGLILIMIGMLIINVSMTMLITKFLFSKGGVN